MSKQLKKSKDPKKKLNAYAKYSSITIQMALIIIIGVFSGLKLDRYLDNSFPIFTLALSVISVTIAVYLAIKDVIKFNS